MTFAPAQVPTELVAWINEFDSVRNMDDDALGSNTESALKKLTADFKRRVYMEEQKGTTGQTIPERKTNCLHDL